MLGRKNREENYFFNRFAEIPYLNSSLFEKQDVETGQGFYHNGIMISELKNEPIRIYPSSVLGKKVKKDPDILTYIKLNLQQIGGQFESVDNYNK